ncbi:hypothetical protein San01_17160 [Streptomyces angustmyceticus]|uniref:Uncharacterized protein n=1 Tax=Streptomyces angustmyceticus TaxID=285578 RepID=A0A5J4LCB8_9ACTN|nr:hypothetical protein San01_17160 [Streptomyces angustmyceticus]
MQAKDAPWAREIELRDLDGNRLRSGTPTEWPSPAARGREAVLVAESLSGGRLMTPGMGR